MKHLSNAAYHRVILRAIRSLPGMKHASFSGVPSPEFDELHCLGKLRLLGDEPVSAIRRQLLDTYLQDDGTVYHWQIIYGIRMKDGGIEAVTANEMQAGCQPEDGVMFGELTL